MIYWISCGITGQVKQPRSLKTIYGLIRPSWLYFTVTLRNTWLGSATVFRRIVYGELRSSTDTRKLLLIIIVAVCCTLLQAYIVYRPRQHITEIVCDRKLLYIFVYDTEKHDRDKEPCNTAKYGRIRSVVERLHLYTVVYGFRNPRPGYVSVLVAFAVATIIQLAHHFVTRWSRLSTATQIARSVLSHLYPLLEWIGAYNFSLCLFVFIISTTEMRKIIFFRSFPHAN